tara:strand:+ start:329 stop:520 length:192 start_codon:yes stop_codon:yes gene_type:complete
MKLQVYIGIEFTFLTNSAKCEEILSQRRKKQPDDSRKYRKNNKQSIFKVDIIPDYFSPEIQEK